LDLEEPRRLRGAPFEVVYCYGTLYHVSRPSEVIDYLSDSCSKILLLETCVSFGHELNVNLISEARRNPSQAFSGTGCRPTRPWVVQHLEKNFDFVYVPLTQPNHDEFPVDWSQPRKPSTGLVRAVFVASRSPIENPLLITELPSKQHRHP
jgi:hypothetical protein